MTDTSILVPFWGSIVCANVYMAVDKPMASIVWFVLAAIILGRAVYIAAKNDR